MANEKEIDEEFASFLDSGFYRLKNSNNAVFIDPVRLLNESYTRFRVSPSVYYSRFCCESSKASGGDLILSASSRKRKRKRKPSHNLNEKELSAEERHRDARPLLLKAHEAFLGATNLISFLCSLNRDEYLLSGNKKLAKTGEGIPSFLDLGSVWQAPFYEIALHLHSRDKLPKEEGWFSQLGKFDVLLKGTELIEDGKRRLVPIFNNLVSNETNDDMEADFLNHWYILPQKSSFHMSDFMQIQNLITGKTCRGFNLIVIDPPWENGSAWQKSLYPTLPNRYFLSIPVKELTHTEGALVALWVTNREKLRLFVEKELFPAWGVRNATTFYWLKVKADGSLVGDLDLFHHRPYECLLLGYTYGKAIDSEHRPTFKPLKDKQVIISIPGDYSRKPPLGKLLLDYIPGPMPARCIELFARELTAGWTSWGNEPLRFQELKYFMNKTTG